MDKNSRAIITAIENGKHLLKKNIQRFFRKSIIPFSLEDVRIAVVTFPILTL